MASVDVKRYKNGLICFTFLIVIPCAAIGSAASFKSPFARLSAQTESTSNAERQFQNLLDQPLIPSANFFKGHTARKKAGTKQREIPVLPESIKRNCLKTANCELLTDGSSSRDKQLGWERELKNSRNKHFHAKKSDRTRDSLAQNSYNSTENSTSNYSAWLNFSGARMTFPLFRIGPRLNLSRELPIHQEPKVGLSIGSVHNQTFDFESSELSRNQEELGKRHGWNRTNLHTMKTSISGSRDAGFDMIYKFCRSVHAVAQRSKTNSTAILRKIICDRNKAAKTFYIVNDSAGTNTGKTQLFYTEGMSEADMSEILNQKNTVNEASAGSKNEMSEKNAHTSSGNESKQKLNSLNQYPGMFKEDKNTHLRASKNRSITTKIRDKLGFSNIQRSKRNTRSSQRDERFKASHGSDSQNTAVKSKVLEDILKLAAPARLTRDNISVKESDIAAIFRGVAYGAVTVAAPLTSPELRAEVSSVMPAVASKSDGLELEAEGGSQEKIPDHVPQVQEDEYPTRADVQEYPANNGETSSRLFGREKEVAKFVIQLPDRSDVPFGAYKESKGSEYRPPEMSQFHESQSQNYFGFPTTIRLLIPPTPYTDETTTFKVITQKSLLKPLLNSPWKKDDLSAVMYFERQSFPTPSANELSLFSTEPSTIARYQDLYGNGSIISLQTRPTFAFQPEEIDYNPEKLFNNSDEYENQNSTLIFGIAIFNVSLLKDLFQLFCDNVEDIWRYYLYCVSGVFCVISSVCFWRLCCQCRTLPFFLHVSFYLVVFASSFVRASIVFWNPFSNYRFGPVEILNVLSIAGEPSIGVVMSSFIALLLNVFYGMVILPFIIAFFSASEMTSGLFLEFAFKYFRIHTGNLSQGNLNLVSFIVGMVWNSVIFMAYVLLLGCEKFRRTRRKSHYKSKGDSKCAWNYSVVAGGCHQISGCCFLVVLAQLSMVCLYIYILIHPKELLSRPKKLGYRWALFQITGRVLEIIVYTSLLISVGKISKSYLYHKNNFMDDSEGCLVSCCQDRDFERKKKRKLGYSSDMYSLQREKENIVRHYPTDDFQLVWSRNSCIQSNQTEAPQIDRNPAATNSVLPATQKSKGLQKTKKLKTVRERNEKLNNLSSRKLCSEERPPSCSVEESLFPQKRNHCEEYCFSKERVEVHRKDIAEPSFNCSQKLPRENYAKSSFQKYEPKTSRSERNEHRIQANNVNRNVSENYSRAEKYAFKSSEYGEENSCKIFVNDIVDVEQPEFSRYSFLKTEEFEVQPQDVGSTSKTATKNGNKRSDPCIDGKCDHEAPEENGTEIPERVQESDSKCEDVDENSSEKTISDLKTDLQKILDVCLPPPDKSMYKYMGVTLPQSVESKSPSGSDPLHNTDVSVVKVACAVNPGKDKSTPGSPEEMSSSASYVKDEEIIIPSPKKFWSPPPNRRMRTFKNLPPMPLKAREPIHLECLSPLKPKPSSPTPCTAAEVSNAPTQAAPAPSYGDWRRDQFYSGEFTVAGCPAYMPRGESVGDFWGCRTSPLRDRMLSADLATVSSFSEMRVDYLTDLSSGDGYSLGSISFHRASRLSFSNISDCLNYY